MTNLDNAQQGTPVWEKAVRAAQQALDHTDVSLNPDLAACLQNTQQQQAFEAEVQARRELHMGGGIMGGSFRNAENRPQTESQIQARFLPQPRTFTTGATRDTDSGKLDYEAFFSPLVLKRYAEYMHKNRLLMDGTLRDGDNWQKGIPQDVYMKSLWRHFMDVWSYWRGIPIRSTLEESVCACLFNLMGFLHERLKAGVNA